MQDADLPPRQRIRMVAVLSNYFYCTTILPGVVAWIVAFASQIAVTKTVGREAVGVLWFAVFLQLFLTVGVFLIFASGEIAAFRLQVSVFGTMAAVFAVIGVDMSIFTGQAARGAMGAAWLVLAVLDILWVLYFSAEPGTPVARLVDVMVVSRGAQDADTNMEKMNGHDSARSARSAEAGNSTTGLYDGEMRSDGSPDETKVGHEKSGDAPHEGSSPEPEVGADWKQMERRIVDRSQEILAEEERPDERSQNLARSPPPASKNRRGVYIEEHRHLSTIYDRSEGTSETTGSQRESVVDLYPFKVRARSDWIPRSPSEISFRQGDILHSAEKEGKKWWKVRKADGTIGTAPSNYLKVLNG
ncbi:hypothetical protein B0H11DRAFT_2021537 [Mycena galericulata]|nr:hypothetical protein B0H11DRAFT_2021537 [Mycena galericulata]